MSRRARVLVAAWPWLLGLAICAPTLAPGYVLSYDMVWVPDLAADREAWGLGTALPRAVPSDLVVALLDDLVPGQLLQKAILLASLGLAGAGAARLCVDRGAVAAVAAASLYVWNPFVAERLVLGHWPLLVGYAALPWIVVAGRRLRSGDGAAWPAMALCLAASAFSAVGGILGLLVALATQVGGRPDTRRRRLLLTFALWLPVNAPWLVAGLAYPDGVTSDPDAVERFAVEPEGWLGRLGALLSLGGIWNADVVPDSRETPIAVLGLLTIGAAVVVGWRRWRSAEPSEALAFAGLAAVAIVVGIAGWLAPGAVSWLVAHGPGLGLLRDGTRILPLLALGQAIAFGWAVSAATAAAARRRRSAASFVAVLAVVWPLALLPDLAWGRGGELEPVAYPDHWYDARTMIDGLGTEGDLMVAPFTSYRAPSWNEGRPVLDPAGRFFGPDTVVNDDLVVSGQLIEGEDPHAAAVQAALDGDREVVAERLGRLGIGAVLVDTEAGPAGLPLDGLDRVWSADGLAIYAVPEPIAEPPRPGTTRRIAVGAGWIAAAATLSLAAAEAARRRLRPPSRRRAGSAPP
jgi:hypothetical protein